MGSPPVRHGLIPLSSSHHIVPWTTSRNGSRGNHPRWGCEAFVRHPPPLRCPRGLGGLASRCVCPVVSADSRPGLAGRVLSAAATRLDAATGFLRPHSSVDCCQPCRASDGRLSESEPWPPRLPAPRLPRRPPFPLFTLHVTVRPGPGASTLRTQWREREPALSGLLIVLDPGPIRSTVPHAHDTDMSVLDIS